MLPDFYHISEENFKKSLKYYNVINNTIKYNHQSLSKFKKYTDEYCSKLDNLLKEGKNIVEEYIIIDPDNINNNSEDDKDIKEKKNNFDMEFIKLIEKSTERIQNFYEILLKYLNDFVLNLDNQTNEIEKKITITKSEVDSIEKDYEKQKDIFKSKLEEVKNINAQLKESYSDCEKDLIKFCYERRLDGIDYENNYKLFYNNLIEEENNLIKKFDSLGNFEKIFLDCTKEKIKQIQDYSFTLFNVYDSLSKNIHDIFNNSVLIPMDKLNEEKNKLIEGEKLDSKFKEILSVILANQTNNVDEAKAKLNLVKYEINVLTNRNIKVHQIVEEKQTNNTKPNKKEKTTDKNTNNNSQKDIMIALTDREIYFIVQNLYSEYKLINKAKYDLELEEKKLELKEIFFRILNTPCEKNNETLDKKDEDFFLIEKSKEITKEEFDDLCSKMEKDDYRKAFLIVINNYRAKGKLEMSEKAFNYFIQILSVVCKNLVQEKKEENDKFVKDPICARLVIILSQTFYTVKNNEKLYLCEELKKEQIFKMPKFWLELIRDMVTNESKSVLENHKQNNPDDESEEKIIKIKNNVYFSQIIPFVENMKDFGIELEDIKKTISIIREEFNIPDETSKRIEDYIVGQFNA